MTEALPIPLPLKDEEAKISSKGTDYSSDNEAEYVDPVIEKRVIRKCDLYVVPPTLLLFMVSFLDRVNIGNARIQNLEKDLNMKGNDFNVALLILFIPFILFEIPSNLVMKKLNPSTWLSACLFGCGVMGICQGVVKNYASLVACRFILGIFEAGIGPGSIYLISMYYRRYELPSRLSWWYVSGVVAGAFGGLLAYAIAKMDGIRHYSGWRWIFIIEGIMTIVVAVICFFWLQDWPETAKFLTSEERKVLVLRLKADRKTHATMDKLDRKTFIRIIKDWKIWVGTLTFFGVVNTNYSTNFFIPTILKQMGYTAEMAQVRSIPIYVVAAFFCFTTCYASDKLKHRYGFVLFGALFGATGFAVLLGQAHVSVGARYMALFFLVSAGNIVQPIAVSWLLNNCAGHYKRAVATAAQVGFGNAGGIVASNIFFTSEAPRWPTGYGVGLALLLFAGAMSTVMYIGLKMENKKRDAGAIDDRFNLSKEELDNLGDDHPSFRFAY